MEEVFTLANGLKVSSSVVSLENVTAQNNGGGFDAIGEVEIVRNSTVNISNSHVLNQDLEEDFITGGGLRVSTNSTLIIQNATAGKYGGVLVSSQDARAQLDGGGFYAQRRGCH